jgi:sec-independent protein translocase protein TatA
MGLGLDNPLHLAILLLVVLLLFGAKRVPEIGRSLGEGIRDFKDSITGVVDRPPPADTESLTANTSVAGDTRGSRADERQPLRSS